MTEGRLNDDPGEWSDPDEEHRANKQQGDPDALAREGDPRGGLQSEQYRLADPRDVVEEDGVAMSGPAGAPQEGESVEERRQREGPSPRSAGCPCGCTRRRPKQRSNAITRDSPR